MKLGPPREGFALFFGILALFAVFLGTQREVFARTPCEEDYRVHCKGLKPGQASSIRCLKAHRQALSPACAEEVESHRSKATEVREACANDRERLCRKEKGYRAVRFCLKRNAHRLSGACKDKVRGLAGK